MAIALDQNIYGFLTFLEWNGQYAANAGNDDFSSFFETPTQTYGPSAQLVEYNSNLTGKLTHGFNTYFKMQGYNSSTQKHEVWFSTGKPLLTPPSGNTLSNIEVVLTWIDR